VRHEGPNLYVSLFYYLSCNLTVKHYQIHALK